MSCRSFASARMSFKSRSAVPSSIQRVATAAESGATNQVDVSFSGSIRRRAACASGDTKYEILKPVATLLASPAACHDMSGASAAIGGGASAGSRP
jgi:hypothetical protein